MPSDLALLNFLIGTLSDILPELPSDTLQGHCAPWPHKELVQLQRG